MSASLSLFSIYLLTLIFRLNGFIWYTILYHFTHQLSSVVGSCNRAQSTYAHLNKRGHKSGVNHKIVLYDANSRKNLFLFVENERRAHKASDSAVKRQKERKATRKVERIETRVRTRCNNKSISVTNSLNAQHYQCAFTERGYLTLNGFALLSVYKCSDWHWNDHNEFYSMLKHIKYLIFSLSSQQQLNIPLRANNITK